MSKKKKIKSVEKSKETVNILESLPEKYRNLIAVLIIVIPLLYYFVPWQIDNLRPTGTDYLSTVGQTHRWAEWNKETGETALWNPSIFGGEPIYPRITPNLIQIDTLIKYLNNFSYWVFWYLLLGGLGFYFFLRYLKIPWYMAIIVAVIFVLLPDWQAQIGEGHNSKLRAIMTLPWFFLSFSYFFDKNNWLGTGLFAFTFSLLVRSHHFQIVFYGILVLFFIYIYPTIKLIIEKKYKDTAGLFSKFIIALALTIMTVAQPLFTTNEYAKYSTRGGNPVKIGEEAKTAKEAGGVSFNYATQWSFSPNEIMDFFIPRFSGGLQGEIYNGDKYPQIKGQQVPGYWGEKPFNGNYASMGMILFLFAIIGVVYYRKDKFVISLAVFVLFSLLLSFGRHFPELYKLFFYFVPFFSKFRAPAMIVNITFIIILILSGFGLKAVASQIKAKDYKWVVSILSAGIFLTLAILFMSDSFSYATAVDAQRYDTNTLNIVKDIRQEFLIADTQKLLMFLAAATIILAAFLMKKIKVEIFVILILLVSLIEIFTVSNRAHNYIPLNNPEKLEESVFKETSITRILSKADDSYRAIVLGRDFTNNHYAYFYPLISGYSAIKLQVIQDVVSHNLYNAPSEDKLNWNIINMMGGKFIISPTKLNNDSLTTLAVDNEKKQVLYLNPNALPKSWFVKKLKQFNAPEDVVVYMNTPEFDPSYIALMVIENPIPQSDSSLDFSIEKSYTGNGQVKLISHNPNKVELDVNIFSTQFLVLSEIYYPKGWTAKLDGEEIDIHKINHLLRGVEIGKGNHKLIFEFEPKTYYASLTSLWIGNLLTLLIILMGIYFVILKKRKLEGEKK